MDNTDLLLYKSRLLQEKARIESEMKEFRQNFLDKNQKEETGELSTLANHPADLGTELSDRDCNAALSRNEKHLLEKVQHALEKMDRNSYGHCDVCGADIPADRLNALPYAATCLGCENAQQDYTDYRYDRPVEEEVLAPYGRSFSDHRNENLSTPGLKAEDIWQQIDRENSRKGDEFQFEDEPFDPDSIIGSAGEPGIVEATDRISNQYYKEQLP